MIISGIKLKEAAAIWILKIKEKHKLSQKAVKEIIDDVTLFFQGLLMDIWEEVECLLQTANITPDTMSSLRALFSSGGKYSQPYKGLETEYNQLKFFKNHFSMVVSNLTSFSQEIIMIPLHWVGTCNNFTWHRTENERIC